MSFSVTKFGGRRPRGFALSGLLLVLGGCSSTGVGNPAPALTLSLSLVNDDSAEPSEGDAAGATGSAGTTDSVGGATDSVGGATDSVGGATDAAAGASDSAAGASAVAASEAGSASSEPTAPPPLPQGAVSDAVIVLGKLHFMPCDKTLGRIFTVPGPFVVDLKRHTTTPKIPDMEATSGGYCGIDAPLAPALAPAALAGRSVFFAGHRADGAFFIVYANMTATLRLRAKDGAKWEGMPNPPRFFWALHPRRWLLSTELNTADTTPYDNRLHAVVIDADHHPALFFALRARIAGISKMYADANANGVFDDADRQAEVGEGLDNAD